MQPEREAHRKQGGAQFNEKMYGKIKPIHILSRNYLRPFEIALRTHVNDPFCRQGRWTLLPQGLMIASKSRINDNKYFAINFDAQGSTHQRGQNLWVSQQHRRNLLNMLKTSRKMDVAYESSSSEKQLNAQNSQKNKKNQPQQSEGFEIAICVCICSEDANVLQQTLNNIKKNVISLVKSGVNQDGIGVFVIFDRIEKIDDSIIEFITKLQNQIINMKSSSNFSQARDDYSKRIIQQPRIHQLQQQYASQKAQVEAAENTFFERHISNILFNQEEIADRKERSFAKVYEEYMNIIKLKHKIQTLKQKKEQSITYTKLPPLVQEKFQQLTKKKYKNYFAAFENILSENIQKDRQIEKKLCIDALIQTESYCDTYLSSRSDLAYFFMHRELIYNKQSQGYYRQQDEQEQQSNQIFHQKRQININLFFAVKYQKADKLSTPNWLFNGFCKQLKPKYLIILGAGVKIKHDAILLMHNHLKNNKNIGGVCGYISLQNQRSLSQQQIKQEDIDCISNIAHKFVDIQKAQKIENHFINIIDKPIQSLFSFVHTLPKAFSGYKMQAIHSPNDPEQLMMRKYFESMISPRDYSSIVQTNISLGWMIGKVFFPLFISQFFLPTHPKSEEQMLYDENANFTQNINLCLGIHKNGYDLAYLADSYSEVSAVKDLHSMFGQRKPWIYSSYFSLQKIWSQFSEMQLCDFFLKLLIFYLNIQEFISYFSVSMYLFIVHIAMRAFYSDILSIYFENKLTTDKVTKFFINTMDFIYIFFILAFIYFSITLNYGNKRFKKLIYFFTTVMGIFLIVFIIVAIHDLIKSGVINDIPYLQQNLVDKSYKYSWYNYSKILLGLRLVTIAVIGSYILPILLHFITFKKFHVFYVMLTGISSFLFFRPTFMIALNVYSLCKMDDISLKPNATNGICLSKLKKKWKKIKFVYVFKFLFWNIVASFGLLFYEFDYYTRLFTTISIMGIIAAVMTLKIILMVIYSIKYKCQSLLLLCTKKEQSQQSFNYSSAITKHLRRQIYSEVSQKNVTTNIQTLLGKSYQAKQSTQVIQDKSKEYMKQEQQHVHQRNQMREMYEDERI